MKSVIARSEYRLRLPGFELPEPIWLAQREFDYELGKTLDAIADRFEGQPASETGTELQACFARLEQTVQTFGLRDRQKALPEQLATFLALSRRLEELGILLDHEIRPLS